MDLSFQLADEPSLGTYTINVASTKASSTFSVEEYGMMKRGGERSEERKLLSINRVSNGPKKCDGKTFSSE